MDFISDWLQTIVGQYPLWLMLLSAFVSATILPANSELLFVGLLLQQRAVDNFADFLPSLLPLLAVATLGNSLGGLTNYALGRCLPRLKNRPLNARQKFWQKQLKRRGNWLLLLSWLPIIGDGLCLLSGWLRLNFYSALFFISLGKLLRYSFLAYSVYLLR